MEFQTNQRLDLWMPRPFVSPGYRSTKDRLRNATSAEAGPNLLVEVLQRFIFQDVSTRRGGMVEEEFGILRSCDD